MKRSQPRPANTLPTYGREVLLRASQVGKPNSIERAKAIETAIDEVRNKYPQFFQPVKE